jgi:hypothetical protein
MACGTVVGTALEFGVASDEASLVTQSVKATRKRDKKEARDKCGIVVAVAYYNPTADIEITGLGSSAAALAATLTLAGSFQLGSGNIYVDEVSIEKGNEDFTKSTIKATQYGGIT